MIVLHEQTRTIGRMVSSNRAEITFAPACTFELLQFGIWRFSDDHQVYPRHELRCFLSRDACEKALRKMMELQ